MIVGYPPFVDEDPPWTQQGFHGNCRCRLRLKIFKAPVLQIHMSYVVSMYVTCILYKAYASLPSCSIFSCGYPMSKDGNLSEDPGLEPNLEVWRCESKKVPLKNTTQAIHGKLLISNLQAPRVLVCLNPRALELYTSELSIVSHWVFQLLSPGNVGFAEWQWRARLKTHILTAGIGVFFSPSGRQDHLPEDFSQGGREVRARMGGTPPRTIYWKPEVFSADESGFDFFSHSLFLISQCLLV